MLPEIKRFADRLLHSRRAPAAQAATSSKPSLLGEAFHYHCGDHWQNLLASPMDARHYVLEDWNTSASAFELSDALYESEPYSRGETRNLSRRQA